MYKCRVRCDSGLFAIAYATVLANSIQPKECVLKHLYKCLNKDEFLLVKSKQQSRSAVKSEDYIELFCTNCHMPEILPMVECKEWHHVHCTYVPQAALDNTGVEWTCPAC